MASKNPNDSNSATNWEEPASKKDPLDLSTQAPTLPVSTDIDPARAARRDAAAQAENDGTEIARSRVNEWLHSFHGTTDDQVDGAQKQAVSDPRFSSTLFLTTGRIPVGQTVKENNRDKELFNPGIHVEAPGLDRWHAMNPNAKAAPSNNLSATTQPDFKRAIAQIQTPVAFPSTQSSPAFKAPAAPVQAAQNNPKKERAT